MKFGVLASILVFLFGLKDVAAEKLTFYESSFYTNSIGYPMSFGWFDGVQIWVWFAVFLIFWIVLYMLIRNFWLFKDHEGVSSILAMLLAFVAAASPFSNFVNEIVTLVGFGGPGLLLLLAFFGLIWLGLKVKIRWRRRVGNGNKPVEPTPPQRSNKPKWPMGRPKPYSSGGWRIVRGWEYRRGADGRWRRKKAGVSGIPGVYVKLGQVPRRLLSRAERRTLRGK